MRVLALFVIAATLLGETQISNAQSAYFISVVCPRWPQGLECHVLLLHELGAVPGDNVRHRRELRPEPILRCATETASSDEASTASTTRLKERP